MRAICLLLLGVVVVSAQRRLALPDPRSCANRKYPQRYFTIAFSNLANARPTRWKITGNSEEWRALIRDSLECVTRCSFVQITSVIERLRFCDTKARTPGLYFTSNSSLKSFNFAFSCSARMLFLRFNSYVNKMHYKYSRISNSRRKRFRFSLRDNYLCKIMDLIKLLSVLWSERI